MKIWLEGLYQIFYANISNEIYLSSPLFFCKYMKYKNKNPD